MSCDGPGGFLKESGATGYAQGGERCYGSLDNGVQNLLPGDFLWIVHRDICFKGFVFFCHSGQRRGICGHKNDCIQILHFVQNNSFISEIQIFTEIQVYFRVTVSFQKGRSLQKYRSTSEQPFHFRKSDLCRNTGLLQNNRFISERQILSDFRSPESSGVFFRLVI